MKNIVFILLSFGLAAEMEVDGNLKVTGTVDANGNPITNVGAPLLSTDAVNAGTLASVLNDDGVYEYLAYKVLIYPSQDNRNMEWIQLGDNTEASFSSNFMTELNERTLEGYSVYSMMNLPYTQLHQWGGNPTQGASSTNSRSYTLFMLRRPISDD